MRSCDQQHVSRLGKREDGCVLFVLSASCGKVTVIYGIIEQSWLFLPLLNVSHQIKGNSIRGFSKLPKLALLTFLYCLNIGMS